MPEGLLKKCNACKAAIVTEDVKNNYYICPKCHNYFRVHARRRVEMIADEGTFEEWDHGLNAGNPLSFPGYEEAGRSSSLHEGSKAMPASVVLEMTKRISGFSARAM